MSNTWPSISEEEFRSFQRFIYEAAGITLASSKKSLVSCRLAKRLESCQLDNYAAYFRLLSSGNADAEVQTAIDLLTTNETYFFRESKHFVLLRKLVCAARNRTRTFRVWSAASSTGEEAYSIAMVLADCLGEQPWEVIGTDISQRVVERARRGHYPLARTTHIPPEYLKRFCLKGIGPEQGTLLVQRDLRSRVHFMLANLNESLPQLGTFDVVFLRNVLIYFDENTRRNVVRRVVSQLAPDGFLMVGHSESLHGLGQALAQHAPSVYQRAATVAPRQGP